MVPGSAVSRHVVDGPQPAEGDDQIVDLEPGRAGRVRRLGRCVTARPPSTSVLRRRTAPVSGSSGARRRSGAPRAQPLDAGGRQVAEAVQDLGQAAGQVEDERQQADAAGEELDGRRGPEDGRQPDQVERAEHRARDRAEAADHHHRDHQDRHRRVEGVGAEALGGEGEAHPGVAGHEPRQGEGQQLGAHDRDAQAPAAVSLSRTAMSRRAMPRSRHTRTMRTETIEHGEREPGEGPFRGQARARTGVGRGDQRGLGIGEARCRSSCGSPAPSSTAWPAPRSA